MHDFLLKLYFPKIKDKNIPTDGVSLKGKVRRREPQRSEVQNAILP